MLNVGSGCQQLSNGPEKKRTHVDRTQRSGHSRWLNRAGDCLRALVPSLQRVRRSDSFQESWERQPIMEETVSAWSLEGWGPRGMEKGHRRQENKTQGETDRSCGMNEAFLREYKPQGNRKKLLWPNCAKSSQNICLLLSSSWLNRDYSPF